MKTKQRILAALTALIMCLTMFPTAALAGYDTASAHVNSVPVPAFTYTGEYAAYGQIAVGDPFDLQLGWMTYTDSDPQPVGEIKEIALVAADDPERVYILYKNGAAYYGATATVNGNDALLKGVDSASIQPGSYFTYVTSEDDGGVNTMRSTTLQAFSMKTPEGPSGPGGEDPGFTVEPFFFKDGELTDPVTSIPIGSEFALSVYAGDPADVLLMELFCDGDPFHEYVLYEDGQVFYGGAIDNASEGPGFMTGFSSAEFEPGDYYLKIVTRNGADGTHEPCVTFTGESHVKPGPAIGTATLPEAKEDEPYSAALKAEAKYGGAITWSCTGALPTGLTLDAQTGVISGTPKSGGSFSFVVKATEAGGGSSTASLSVVVKSVPKYTVSFSLNGGKAAAGADYNTKSVKAGSSVTLPAAPTKSGFKFVYWVNDGTAYLPGTVLSVQNTMSFSAEFTARAPMKVAVPESLNDAVGSLWLTGTDAGGNVFWLWNDWNPRTLNVEVPQYNLRDKTFTKLELRGYVDDVPGVVLASYTGTVTEETETVTLAASDLRWQTVRGAEVTGVPQTAYYADDYRIEKSDGTQQYFSPPFMTAAQTFKVRISSRGDAEDDARYDLKGDYTTSTLKNGKLVITPLKLTDSAAVSISAELDGEKYSGTVTATQTVGGYARTVSGYHYAGRPFSLRLYPGIETRFSLSDINGKVYLFEGAALASPVNGAAHTIRGRTLKLETNVSIETNLDPALVRRYLNYNIRSFSVTPKGGTKEACNRYDWSGWQPDLTGRINATLRDVSENADVTATYISACTFPASADTRLKEGSGTAHITAKLRPGVVGSLAAKVTSACFFAWFDAAGKYIGSSDSFYLSAWEHDVSSLCPTGKAGSYTVALLPAVYRSERFLTGKDPSGLKEQILASWPVTLAANGVAELAPGRLDAAASENAAFLTKPHTTLQASAESFSDVTDVLCFSGTIGLDPGLENGKLKGLSVSTARNGLSASVSSVVIAGVSYPLSDPQWSNYAGSYYLSLKEPVDLPCTYSIYASPYSASNDVEISVNADVTCIAFGTSRNASEQKVGDAAVKRPGSFISVPSTYVCADTTLVTGTAKPLETVDVYDNGALVSTAAADSAGAWAATVPLRGIDDTYTTVHTLWAESASGVVSNTATVIHRKNGPQLLSLNLVLNGTEQNGTYFFASAMSGASSVKFRLTFANPGELAPMKEWNNAKAVVKVYMGNGSIVFLEAHPQTDGSFVADFGRLNSGYIDGVEAIYIPKNGPADLTENKDESLTMTATSEESKEFFDAISEMRGLLSTDKKGKPVYAGITDKQSFRVDFDKNNKATVSGGLAGTVGVNDRKAMETFLTELEKKTSENGLLYKELSSGVGENKNILEWLNDIGSAKGKENAEQKDKATVSLCQRSQIFSAKESFDNTKTWLTRYATDKKYAENAAGNNHVRYVYGENSTGDIYTISDYLYDDEGNWLSGTYRIVASLLADTSAAPAIYTAGVSVELAPNFKGFAGLKAQSGAKKAPGFLSLFTVAANASDVDVSGLSGITFDGKFSDEPSYAQSSKAESLVGDIANHTGNAGGFITNSTNVLKGGWQTFGNGLGYVNMAASVYHLKQTWDNAGYRIKKNVEMEYDLKRLTESTCYKRLSESKRQLVDEAMNKFRKAQKDYDTWDGWSTGLNLGLDVGSVICDGLSNCDKDFGVVGYALTGLSYLNGATLGKSAGKARQKLIQQYEESYRTIKSIFSSHAQQTGLDDCKKLKKDESNNKTYQINHDPSGVVYEGVIENPVTGATVTLWYGVDANGRLVTEKDAKNVKKVVPAAEVKKSPQETVQTTGADGKYAWFVPQGLWYVTAEYAGLSGDSDADKAAAVKVSGVKANGRTVTGLLPVLPEQLDVNIPLTDKTAPAVQSVRYTDKGIYVTFSKYMVDTANGADSVLNAANYTLKTKDGAVAVGGVKAVEQGHTPSNIDGANTKTYTRTVLIEPKTALKVGTEALLTVGKAVKSYAGTAMTAGFADSGTVTAQTPLPAPVIAGGAKQTVPYGSGVTLTLPDGAPEGTEIRYTTDGSAPTKDGRLYGHPFDATNKMTVRAIAVCPGYPDSAVVSADFVIAEAQQYHVAGVVRTDGNTDPAGITLTLAGGGHTKTAKAAADGSFAFPDVPVGSYKLTFAGTKTLGAASVPVTVATFDPWISLTLADSDKTPAYKPGDVNEDGKITSADARLALRRAVNLEDYPVGSAKFLACDADGNGTVAAADARLILRAAVGLEDASKWPAA